MTLFYYNFYFDVKKIVLSAVATRQTATTINISTHQIFIIKLQNYYH